jgi:hypothetical protein
LVILNKKVNDLFFLSPTLKGGKKRAFSKKEFTLLSTLGFVFRRGGRGQNK